MVHNAKKELIHFTLQYKNFTSLYFCGWFLSWNLSSCSMHWSILLLWFPFSLLKFLDIWFHLIIWCHVVAGVYLAERLNRVMGDYWRSFASQNYFDPHGLFLSVLWSGPLLIIATIILVGVWSYPFHLLAFFIFFAIHSDPIILFADKLPLLPVLHDCSVEKGRAKTLREAGSWE